MVEKAIKFSIFPVVYMDTVPTIIHPTLAKMTSIFEA